MGIFWAIHQILILLVQMYFSVFLFLTCSLQGSIFAVLESDEAAKTFVARDDVKQFKGNDMIVLIK